MTESERDEMLGNLVGQRITGIEVVHEAGVLMPCFSEGKTLYVVGENLSIKMEAAS